MTLTIDARSSRSQQLAAVGAVTEAVFEAYRARNELVVREERFAADGRVRMVTAIDAGMVELVLGASPHRGVFDLTIELVAELTRDAMDVVVLVPAPHVGAAHRFLRGSECRLQSWWIEDGTPRFGAFEIP